MKIVSGCRCGVIEHLKDNLYIKDDNVELKVSIDFNGFSLKMKHCWECGAKIWVDGERKIEKIHPSVEFKQIKDTSYFFAVSGEVVDNRKKIIEIIDWINGHEKGED